MASDALAVTRRAWPDGELVTVNDPDAGPVLALTDEQARQLAANLLEATGLPGLDRMRAIVCRVAESDPGTLDACENGCCYYCGAEEEQPEGTIEWVLPHRPDCLWILARRQVEFEDVLTKAIGAPR